VSLNIFHLAGKIRTERGWVVLRREVSRTANMGTGTHQECPGLGGLLLMHEWLEALYFMAILSPE
jgi:hypothetical protein